MRLTHPISTGSSLVRPAVLQTPDRRYIVVRQRLWRSANPELDEATRQALVQALMDARRAVKTAMAAKDAVALALARANVNRAKMNLGERGPVWWTDGAPDLNRHLVKNTPYRDWYEALGLENVHE